MNVSINELVASPRYNAALKEIADSIDSKITTIPFVEPQLCNFIDDDAATQLLQKETAQNDAQMEKLTNIFHEIIEDVLLSECELQPLEKKRDELWKSFTKSSYAKLIDKYETIARDEAALIVDFRNQIKVKEPEMPLEDACRAAESESKRLRRESKSLSAQITKIEQKIENDKRKFGDFEDDEEENEEEDITREMEEQVQQAEAEVEDLEEQRNALEGDCAQMKEEIEAMMQEIVALDPRSVGNKLGRKKSRKQ